MKTITQDQLQEILRKHALWLNDEDGKQADLSNANLRNADLSDADLRNADLSYADLRGANLRNADLSNADLDFSAWPLWCGSLGVKVDKRLAAQLAYHFCRLDCDDDEVKAAQQALIPLANQFHRADECGRLEAEQ